MSSSAPSIIVRSLTSVNGRPFSPQRVCRKRTGPRDVSLMTRAASVTGTRDTTPMRTERKMSTTRLTRSDMPSPGVVENGREEVHHEPRLHAHLLAEQEDVFELRQVAAVHGEDDLVDREFREDLREVLQRAAKRHSVRGRRLAVLGGFLAHEAEELQTPPGVLADEPGHRRGARRVAHEDDRAEVEPQRAHAPGHEADRHPLGDGEEDVHDEEDGQERARDEVPPRAEHDEREEEASEEGRARHERDLILQAQRAVAAIRAPEEQETRENEDRGRDEHEIEVEFVERREPAEETGKKLAAKRVSHGQRRERDAEVSRVQESGDRPGLLLQHSEPGAIPLPPGC